MPRRKRIPIGVDITTERLHQVVSEIPAVIWTTDAELRFTSSQGAGLAAIGLAPDQVVGLTLQEFFQTDDEAFASIVAHRSALAGSRTAYVENFAGRQFRTVVEPLRDATGHVRGTYGCAFDITDQTRAEAAQRSQDALLRAVIETTPECIKLLDRNNRLLQMNAAGLAMIEADSETDVRGQDLLSLVDPDDRAAFAALTRDVFAGRPGHLEFSITGLKGRRRRLDTTAAPLRDADGTIHALLGVTRDVTERERLEEQVRHAQKMEALGLLAGGVAHDFNNFLTAITSHAQFVLDELPDADPRRDDLLEIRRAAHRAADLTRQLLAFSHKQMVELSVLDLNTVVTGMRTLLTRLLGEAVRLELQLAPDLWPVRANAGQLEQVLINLALNARDAMPSGGAFIITSANRTGPDAEEDRVRLTLADSGEGMDAATKRRLFEPFFTTKGLGRGTGLGLATVHGIVQQLEGTITVESTPGVGTTFTIELPRTTAAYPAGTPSAAAPEAPARGSETVLLVEDEAAVRSVARRTLTAAGFHVLEAASPAHALEVWQESWSTIEILVTDVVMPELGGRELARRLRNDRPTLPVLFISGYTDDPTIRREVQDRTTYFLAKPFAPELLAGKVREVLDSRR